MHPFFGVGGAGRRGVMVSGRCGGGGLGIRSRHRSPAPGVLGAVEDGVGGPVHESARRSQPWVSGNLPP